MVGGQYKLWILFVALCLAYPMELLSVNLAESTDRPKIGLVLSGGAAKGLAHIGVLKVLEEIGIPIDYVGGTSMGSIVAGLYAIGYNAAEIEKISLDQDWLYLLTDRLQRQSLSIKEKEDYDKYLVGFPMQNLRFKLPSGFGAGQNISMVLSKLSIPVSEIQDFSKFHRPFLCVATDIESGEEVVLRDGYLPDAIRASMALPTVLTPVEIDGRLLVDGGLINNFPVDQVKKMGPDIIIGVNLGLKEYTKEDLKNLAVVLEQSIFFQAKERNRQNQKLCDYLITPEVYEKTAASFTNAAELIRIGEVAANKLRPELELLVDSFKLKKLPPTKLNFRDSLNVTSLQITGLEKVTAQFLYGKLRLKIPGKIALRELEEGIERAYGTQFFRKINYRLDNNDDGSVNILLRIEEGTSDLIKIGARYDSQFKTQLLLNTTFRNKLLKGSKLSLDLYLGLYPRFTAQYSINTGWKPRKRKLFFKNQNLGMLPDFGLVFDTRTLKFDYYEDGDLRENYHYQYLILRAYGSSSISNAFYIEGGVSYDFSGLQSVFRYDEEPIDNSALNLYGFIKADSYNKRAYPTRGAFFYSTIEAIKDFNIRSERIIPTTRLLLKAEKVFTPFENLSIQPRIESGIVIGDTVSPLHRLFLGGNLHNSTLPIGDFSFVGFRFMEKMDQSLLTAGLKLRLNFWKNHHLVFDNNIGKIAENYDEIINNPPKLYYGYGFQYAYNSIIGPLDIGVYKSNTNIGWILFMNIGFRF